MAMDRRVVSGNVCGAECGPECGAVCGSECGSECGVVSRLRSCMMSRHSLGWRLPPFSKWLPAVGLMVALGGSLWGAGTFGKVVAIGGQASDLALDESRGVLYVANFTANRIEVMSLSTNTIQTSINVAAQPSSLAISPD